MNVLPQNLLFTPQPWQLEANKLTAVQSMLEETLFALANGYLGTRGTMEEGAVANHQSCEGTYLNGVYHSEKITYGEVAYGYASHNQKMQQVPNGKVIKLKLDDQPINLADAMEATRWLDFRTATLHRQMRWQSNSGRQLSLNTRRFASLSHPNLLCLRMEILAENFSGDIELNALLDAGYRFSPNKDDPRVGVLSLDDSLALYQQHAGDNDAWMLHRVKGGEFNIASLSTLNCTVTPRHISQITHEKQVGQQWLLPLKQGEPVIVEKYICYQHSKELTFETLLDEAQQKVHEAKMLGWDALHSQHQQAADAFWQNTDVQIDGDPALQQGIRFNLLHLFMSIGKDGHSNMGAKGLTGHGYDGHYFWDTEIYILSVMTATNPELAKRCLEYRYRTLEGARQRARQMSHSQGALYPWRTIGGDECSAFFPAGTAQYHINAAIAHALRSYYSATADWQFMQEMGAEILFETARLWLSLGHFNARRDGQFCIDGVTGPDEYTAIVSNNFYTNAMAKAHLRFAVQMAAKFRHKDLTAYEQLCIRLSLSESEISAWKQAAEKMYLPFDETLKIHAQDDSFLDKQPWDFANTPRDKYPLLLHFHPLVIYRHQVLKQADVVLAMYLLDDTFDQAQKARNLAYYEPLTTHDSTLSSCIHSIEFAETGDYQRAYEFFHDTVRMDIDNRHGNTEYGVHTACMAGSWMSIVHGFAGVRMRPDGLTVNPHLPDHWQGYTFNLQYQGRQIQIKVSKDKVSYLLKDGESLSLQQGTQQVQLNKGQWLNVSRGDL
ncbi:glycoside hydrolase family 65 protein [Bowmanella sp. Y26]|uniref:glycoside hydrolase family 65 protein n=1 Tax=Bowmanella yangjiangensis TaxID=2811230 RepID=UPI001BDC9E5E|nr:glycosyl hydrolase family 65 protein [Bowmanella yangjiangensis]MBT1062023.1 glycoside hydrolase family 65 protein [Bowmanella yangjiangensis]